MEERICERDEVWKVEGVTDGDSYFVASVYDA